jgi:hypothetical protein
MVTKHHVTKHNTLNLAAVLSHDLIERYRPYIGKPRPPTRNPFGELSYDRT